MLKKMRTSLLHPMGSNTSMVNQSDLRRMKNVNVIFLRSFLVTLIKSEVISIVKEGKAKIKAKLANMNIIQGNEEAQDVDAA